MAANNIEGPTVLWGELKGRKVKSNDGMDLGEIDKISQNYIKLEKGTIKKEKLWIPKYLADAFDGKVLWLLIGEEETRAKFQYGDEPSAEQYEKDFGSFKTSSYGHNRTWDADKVSVTPERTIGIPTKSADSNEDYKNVRDLK
ncbi:MAG: hypothetical protein WCE93_06625 [Nitrososphaeraceae archaeon]